MTAAYTYNPAMWPPIAAALFLAALAGYSARRGHVPGALPLAIGSAFGVLWLVGLAMTALAADPATRLFWHRFQALWQLPGVTATTCFVLEYTEPGRWLRPRTLIALTSVCVIAFFTVIYNGSALMWRTLSVTPNGTVALTYAPPGLLLMIYGLSLFLINIAAALRLFLRSPGHRWPAVLLILAGGASRGIYMVAISEDERGAYATTLVVLAIVLSWTLYAVALFGFRILDPLGAARQTVIRQMREGMIVFDNAWRVVSVNPAAERLLAAPATRLRGQTWQAVLPGAPAPPEPLAGGSPAGELWQPDERAAAARCYALDLSPLTDPRGLPAGSLLLLLDITEQRAAQAQAQTQQRTLAILRERERLARELHDNLAQVLAFVNTQGQTARRLVERGDAAAASQHLARLVEVAQEADVDLREAILGLRVALADQGLLPALAAYLRQYEKRTGICAELITASAISDATFDPQVEAQFLRIVQEALTNARKHGQARAVRVTVGHEATAACVRITDDGCGFAAGAAASDAGGIGLRVMRERAEEMGGVLEVQSAPGCGTTVSVTVPLAAHTGGTNHARAAG